MTQFSAALRKIANCQAIRPDIAGIMGAFGAALIARERYQEGEKTSMLSIDQINDLGTPTTSRANCRGCTNNCRLTINDSPAAVNTSAETAVEGADFWKEKNKIISRTFSITNIRGSFPMNLFPQIRLPVDRLVSPVF